MVEIGDRIKLQRQAHQLSLQDLANLMTADGFPVTRATLSNYETNKIIPSEIALEALARELGTTVEFLTKKNPMEISLCFFSDMELILKRFNELCSFLQVNPEKMFEIDQLLGVSNSWKKPKKLIIQKGKEDEIEDLAEEIRALWKLDDYPVASVSGVLEKNGWSLIWIPNKLCENSLVGVESISGKPFLGYQTPQSVVDMRMQLLKAVGTSYFSGENLEHTEKLARRFARTILFPRSQVLIEYGYSREHIFSSELTILKQKYGLGKFEIMHRLHDLGVISNTLFNTYISSARLYGYPSGRDILTETVSFHEVPVAYQMKVMSAYEKGLISAEQLKSHRLLLETYTFESQVQ